MIVYGEFGDSFIVRFEENQYIVEELVGAGFTYLPKKRFDDKADAITEVIREYGKAAVTQRYREERGLR